MKLIGHDEICKITEEQWKALSLAGPLSTSVTFSVDIPPSTYAKLMEMAGVKVERVPVVSSELRQLILDEEDKDETVTLNRHQRRAILAKRKNRSTNK